MSVARSAVAIACERLSVRRGPHEAVREVSLRARAGEVVAVLGASGAGKSSLLAALAGDLDAGAAPAACDGRVLLEGADVTRAALHVRARAGLAYVAQGPSVLWDLTAEENLLTFARLAARDAGRRISSLDGAEAASPRVFARAALARFGLETRARVKARELSGGERRRLEVARSLVLAPCVVICDEPFAAADRDGARAVAHALRAHADAGAAIVIADHRLEIVAAVADRAVVVAEGRIVERLSASGLRERAASAAIRS